MTVSAGGAAIRVASVVAVLPEIPRLRAGLGLRPNFLTPAPIAALAAPAEHRLDCPGTMDWMDYDFIADAPLEDDLLEPIERTGWEVVIFELDDEEPEE